MKYYYVGRTRQAAKVSGAIEARDENEVRLRLRAMQIRPDEIRTRAPKAASINLKLPDLSGGVPAKKLYVFTRQFSSLIDSGVPVVQCLDILWQQESKGIFKNVIAKVKEDIEGGSGLAEAISRHPKVFSEFFIRIVEAGEISGTLDRALRRIGVQMEKLGRLKAKVIGAMVYPVMTVVVSVFVLIFLLIKVIPTVASLYANGKTELPALTSMVLKLSYWMQENYLMVIVGVFAVIAGSVGLYRIEDFRKVWDPLSLRFPIFGSLTTKSSVAQFSRTMATLLSSGVPLLKCFEIAAKIAGNRAIRQSINDASAAVSEGKSMVSGLSLGKTFPPMVLHMIGIGEVTGRLDELMGKVADIYDEEVDDAVGVMTNLLQPILLIGVGGIVATLLLAMYLPIFTLADTLSSG